MTDYLEQIAAAKTEVGRLKGEKEAFEQSSPPDDGDDEDLEDWNYAKDLERQIRELKSENRDALKELAKAEKAAARLKATEVHRRAACAAKEEMKPMLDQIAALEAALAPYEQIKRNLAAARARFRKLTNEFVDELKNRCGFMGDDKKRAFVLELLAQDVQAGLDDAFSEKRQVVAQFIEAAWDKYRVKLVELRSERNEVEQRLSVFLEQLNYT
jgi:type I restriction enzyme M protein